MTQETNPFRASMLRRSQSPTDDPFDSLSTHSFEPPVIQYPQGNTSRNGSVSSDINVPVPRQNNPFRVDLSDSPSPVAVPSPPAAGGPAAAGSSAAAGASSSLEPPSYFESEGRRHSEPNLVGPADEKSQISRNYDSYREGYEEGMRIARERERQRRRELRERRSRHGGERERGEHVSSSSGSKEHSSRRSRSKSESRHRSSKPKAPNASLDVIDKMDVTGVYGGSGFHHDGPFDACAPHRNKTSKRNIATPISAFPADGPNNSLAVEDPRLLAYRKEETVYGRNANVDAPPEVTQASFDPTDRGAKVHGQQTLGLGSSTFIDGTPASRDAIEQAQAGRQRSRSLGRSRSLLRRPANDDYNNDEPKSLLSRVRSLRVSRS